MKQHCTQPCFAIVIPSRFHYSTRSDSSPFTLPTNVLCNARADARRPALLGCYYNFCTCNVGYRQPWPTFLPPLTFCTCKGQCRQPWPASLVACDSQCMKGLCMQGLMQNSPASPFWSPVTVSACKGSCMQGLKHARAHAYSPASPFGLPPTL